MLKLLENLILDDSMLISFSNLKRKYNMNIKGIIHIGAHYGEEIVIILMKGIQNVVVFEPLNDNFDILCENSQDLNANIEGHQVHLVQKNVNIQCILVIMKNKVVQY